MLAEGWRLFEQRRPAAAEKEFRAALALKPDWADALVAIGLRACDRATRMLRARSSTRFCACPKNCHRAARVRAKDAFSRKEAQAYLRASHALGCLPSTRNATRMLWWISSACMR